MSTTEQRTREHGMGDQCIGHGEQVTTKQCTKCGETKPLEESSPDRRFRDGKQKPLQGMPFAEIQA
jgi:hypothetical protein